MAIHNFYSKRRKKQENGNSDVYIYDEIPAQLKQQILFIMQDAIGNDSQDPYLSNLCYKAYNILCREYGIERLPDESFSLYYNRSIFSYFSSTNRNFDEILDFIELMFTLINNEVRSLDYQLHANGIKITPDEAINDLNERFKEHNIGYQFESDELSRIDSTFIHSEIIKPTLNFLRDTIYKGANEEFLKAHEHYRHGRNKECLVECLKSLESVIKVICTQHSWEFKKTDNAQKLITLCFTNKLIPDYLQSEFNSLQSLLVSGIPTIRNKLGGHGQGTKIINADDDITLYALNITASSIFFLVNAAKKVENIEIND